MQVDFSISWLTDACKHFCWPLLFQLERSWCVSKFLLLSPNATEKQNNREHDLLYKCRDFNHSELCFVPAKQVSSVIHSRSSAVFIDNSSAIVNEEGARLLRFKDPIGKTVKHNGKPFTIIGVTKNMLVNNPYDKIQPAIFLGEGGHSTQIIRIKPGTPVRTALATIESVYKKFNPSSPFIYHFNDEDYERKFLAETQIGNLATVFSGLAILITCLGLFGLASFVAEQRTKEIGVRKVLGARVVNLWALLSGDFLKLVIPACLISMPLSYFFMSRWLQNYTFHTSLSLWVFVAAGAGILAITLATVSYQALKAALMNPVKSLRSE